MGECQGLTGGGLIKAFRTSEIFKSYRFREASARRTTSVDFAERTESDLDDQSFRWHSPTYLRSINRISQKCV